MIEKNESESGSADGLLRRHTSVSEIHVDDHPIMALDRRIMNRLIQTATETLPSPFRCVCPLPMSRQS